MLYKNVKYLSYTGALLSASFILEVNGFLCINSNILCVCTYQASQAWMEWLMKKQKAFDQRGDMAIAAWAEQQQREMNLRARRLSRSKVYKYIILYT